MNLWYISIRGGIMKKNICISILFFCLFLSACSKNVSVNVPEDWDVEKISDSGYDYFLDGNYIGSFYTQIYNKDSLDPLQDVMPNHSETVEVNELEGYNTEAYEYIVTTSHPAVANDNSVENWIHILLVYKEEKIYDFFINIKYVDESEILLIAKSIK